MLVAMPPPLDALLPAASSRLTRARQARAGAAAAWHRVRAAGEAAPRRSRRLVALLGLAGAGIAAAVAGPGWSSAASVAQSARPTAVVPSVGALFSVSSGGALGAHFCTASVVDSSAKDLVVTAAHCVAGMQPSQVVFVPGYHAGDEPYGLWYATAIYVDRSWQQSADPDDDFAFLAVRQASSSQPLQAVTGGNQLGVGVKPSTPGPLLKVIGYPDGVDTPVGCASRLKLFSATQLEFDCNGYTNGTSGSPFVVGAAGAGRTGRVVGVIGGYEQGGDSASISYAARFGASTRALFRAASSSAATAEGKATG
jgi:V8-like Glu-specific endopeptidase